MKEVNDRLTIRVKNGHCAGNCWVKPGREVDAVHRLAEYEDTGYTPTEIHELEETIKELRAKIREHVLENDRLKSIIMEVNADALFG